MSELLILVGDVINSQRIPDREAFKQTLATGLDDLNAHIDACYADVQLLKGIDEVAGVFTSVRAALAAHKHLVETVHPEGIRVAVVSGEIDVGLAGESVAGMDGPGFARADEIIQELTRDEQFFALDVEDQTLDTVIGDHVNLLTMLKLGWSDRQHEVTARYEVLGSQQAVADELGVTVQSVSQTLRRAWAKQLLQIQARLDQVATTYDAQLSIPARADT